MYFEFMVFDMTVGRIRDIAFEAVVGRVAEAVLVAAFGLARRAVIRAVVAVFRRIGRAVGEGLRLFARWGGQVIRRDRTGRCPRSVRGERKRGVGRFLDVPPPTHLRFAVA